LLSKGIILLFIIIVMHLSHRSTVVRTWHAVLNPARCYICLSAIGEEALANHLINGLVLDIKWQLWMPFLKRQVWVWILSWIVHQPVLGRSLVKVIDSHWIFAETYRYVSHWW